MAKTTSTKVHNKPDRDYRETIEHVLLMNELNADFYAGASLEDLIKKACNKLKTIHNLNYVDSFLIKHDSQNNKFLSFVHSTLESRIINSVEKLTGLIIKNFKIPIFKGSIYEDIHSSTVPREFFGKDQILRVLEDMVLPKKKLLRMLAPQIAKLLGSNYMYVIPLNDNNVSIGQISFNSNILFDEPTKEALNMVVGKISNILTYKKLVEQIQQKNIELEKLNNTKDKFFSIIAHDLRSPFNSIIGFSDLLKEQIDHQSKEKLKEMVMMINSSAYQAYELLENLLEWSMCERGKMPFHKEKNNLKLLVAEEINKLKKTAFLKEINIKNLVEDSIEIKADVNMMKVIFRNLISNAIKFTNRKGEILILAKQKNGQTKISVKDNGVGINEKMLKSIFKIGIKGTTKGTEQEPGSGLGLILCKEFIKKHKGKIWVESKEGVGSEFIFTIPFK
ncbi:MAG: HAMP domain-containing histidine kinase [Chlorobi bacterium]|nr:HAMP domain-containing histidine kinase [Chlorobiota bacterium]